MPLKVAVQMDPIETINIGGDSTFALMLKAQALGHTCDVTSLRPHAPPAGDPLRCEEAGLKNAQE